MIIPPNWEEWLISWKAGLTFRGTQRSWRNGPTGTSWSLTGIRPSIQMETPKWPGQTGAVWKPCRKEPGVLGRQELQGISAAPLSQGLKEDQPHTELPWQRQCQLVKECDSFPHLWIDIQSTMSSFGPPEHGTFWHNEGAPRGFRVWSLWCAGRGWESSFCLDWEEKAERGLTAVLHYLERDYREDARSHFSEVNKEQKVVDANCRKQGPSWMKGRTFSSPASRQALE